MKNNRVETLLLLIWGQALIATLGSLFFSEILHFVPCKLCWFQRILMYPLVIVYGVALYKKDPRYGLAGYILSGLGIIVAAYHVLIQRFPSLEAGDFCGMLPCTGQYIHWFGFITIPILSLTAFIIIFILHSVMIRK